MFPRILTVLDYRSPYDNPYHGLYRTASKRGEHPKILKSIMVVSEVGVPSWGPGILLGLCSIFVNPVMTMSILMKSVCFLV